MNTGVLLLYTFKNHSFGINSRRL